MSRKWKIGIQLFIILTVSTTVFFGLVETKQFSAYAECRKIAMATKGYGIWKHTDTKQLLFFSAIQFSDNSNYLSCSAIGIGPFWIGIPGFKAEMLGCIKGVSPCPEGYFGISP